MTEIKLNHLALVVADLDESLGFWRDDIGLQPSAIRRLFQTKRSASLFWIWGMPILS